MVKYQVLSGGMWIALLGKIHYPMKKVYSKIKDEGNVSAKGLIVAFLAGCSLALMTYFFW